MRAALIALAVVVFLGISFLVARWLYTDTVERGKVEDLLAAQLAGDGDTVVDQLDCPDARCEALARATTARVRGPGDLEIVRYDAPTSHALGSQTGQARVVWQADGRLPTVQCVLVRREGSALTGASVTLQRLSAPIGRESSCP
ncbi:MAG: hypothetical protein JHC84_06200 [Solirubrobacteraceae bacterium]|nr:hypothetical protein [Solirubrobacteraceae bacterium]